MNQSPSLILSPEPPISPKSSASSTAPLHQIQAKHHQITSMENVGAACHRSTKISKHQHLRSLFVSMVAVPLCLGDAQDCGTKA
uniref:Uncharacterized protein n=1 Tax=Arundo donax TaxID=35708 RepID=A0A0A9CP52_ARUDO